jgi:hypothetical protein
MTDEITIPVPDAPDVNTIVERPEQAMSHVVGHENRLTQLEHKFEQNIIDVNSQIRNTSQSLTEAIDRSRTEQASMLEDRLRVLDEIKSKLESQVIEAPQETIEQIEQAPSEAVSLVPEVESTPGTKPQPRGMRARRKLRHTKHAE